MEIQDVADYLLQANDWLQLKCRHNAIAFVPPDIEDYGAYHLVLTPRAYPLPTGSPCPVLPPPTTKATGAWAARFALHMSPFAAAACLTYGGDRKSVV